MTPRAVELFAGAGGLALGAERAGFEHVALVEYYKPACATLRLKDEWRAAVREVDARQVFDAFKRWRGERLDLIAGGPPCQPFSGAGKRRGPEDLRNMFPHAIRAVDQARPRAFLFENVAGVLKQPNRGYYVDDVIPALKDLGYDVAFTEPPLWCADYGVPQLRPRVIAVGFRRDLGVRWSWPAPTHSEDALLWSQWANGGSYWRRHGMEEPDGPPTALVERVASLARPTLAPWRTIRDELGGGAPYVDRLAAKATARRGTSKAVPHTWDWPAHTITTWEDSLAFLTNESGTRELLTVAQAKRLQTFPPEHRIAGRPNEQLTQIGNAVPPDMAAVLMRALAAVLG